MANKLIELNNKGGNYIGGLVVLENNQWYYFNNEKYLKENSESNKIDFEYDYTPGKLSKHWKLFADLFK